MFFGVGELDDYRRDGVLTLFGDGSGGKHSDDQRRRRCGTAVATLEWREGTWCQGAMIAAPLAGPHQTVPRSETLALALALEWSTGTVHFVTDHQGLKKAWPRRSLRATKGPNEDLWTRVRAAAVGREIVI